MATLAKFPDEKSLSKRKSKLLYLEYLGMQGRRNPKFGEVSFQICQKLLRQKRAKFFLFNALLNQVYFIIRSGAYLGGGHCAMAPPLGG